MRKSNKTIRKSYQSFLLYLLCLTSFQSLAFTPLGGYINHEKLTNSICPGGLTLTDYQFDAVIFFEDDNIPDSVLFKFGDSKSAYVKLGNAELLCDGLWKCTYDTIYQYFYCGTFILNVTIDTNTLFFGKNANVNTQFFLESVIKLSALTSLDVSYKLLQNGLIDFYPGIRFSLPIETEFIDSLHYSLNSKFSSIPPNSISINSETGDVLIKQLPDTGLFLFIIEVREFHESGSLSNIHFIILSVRNRNTPNIMSFQDSLKIDVAGIFNSRLKPGDTLQYDLYFDAKNIDLLNVNLKTKIPFEKDPKIEILKFNDSFFVKSTFYMDNKSYDALPQSVLFHFTMYKQGNCIEKYHSFYFAPENYKPIGIDELKYKRETFLYPNPTTSLLNLDLEHYYFDLNQISIFNVSGNKMKYQYKNDQLDISDFPPGIYFVLIKNEDEYFIQKIIKQ